MPNEIEQWHAALEEADRRASAGDEQAKKDAIEIANTIRRLQAEENEEPPEPLGLAEPVTYGAVGAAPATFKTIVHGARSLIAPESKPQAASAPQGPRPISSATSPVKVFGLDTSGRAAETSHNVRTAEIAENAKKQKQIMDALYKQNVIASKDIPGIAGSTEAGVALTRGGLEQLNAPPPKPSLGQRVIGGAKALPGTTFQAAKSAPGALINRASNLPLRGPVAGFAAGTLGADAYNYHKLAQDAKERGDTQAEAYYNSMAGLSAVGSGVAATSSVVPKTFPKTRAAAIPAAGLALYNFFRSQAGYPAPEQKATGGLINMDRGGNVIKKAKSFIFPAAEKAGETQIPGTIPTYRKANKILNELGAEGLGMDYGAGLGKGVKVMSGEFQTFEPFHKNKWTPDFVKPEDIPSDAYGRLVNLNVLNVLNPEDRAEAVKNIGRIMEPGGTGIVTTRGMDVLRTKSGYPGPEPTSFVTGKGTYQKGYTPNELQDYLKYMLGQGYDIDRLGLGPAGALIRKKADGGLAHLAGGGDALRALLKSLPKKEADKLPTLRDIEMFRFGPGAAIKPRIIAEEQNLFRQARPQELDNLIRNERDYDIAKLFVTDNPDLAIGQSGNIGANLIFRPNTLSGQQHLKPGTGNLAGKEYVTDLLAPKPLQAFSLDSMSDVKNLSPLVRHFIKSNFERLPDPDFASFVRKQAEGGHTTPAWQRKEGQNPEGGLNAKGRASYHAETGGTLKRPQPEGGKRRDSFCARMKGAKEKLTSAETARDPDSRINKALRKWNC